MNGTLVNFNAMVSGASGSIGSTIARGLAESGANLAVCYSGEKQAALDLVDELRNLERRAVAVELDQRDPANVAAVVDTVRDELGGIDILINNAAWNIGIPFSNLGAMTPEVWDKLFEINLRGPFLLARAAAPLLAATGHGQIVNISSNGGIVPTSSSIAYSVSKAGLMHLTRCLAVALAPDVAVNCIAPGVVKGTRMSARMPPDVLEREASESVLRRTATAEDIARQVIALCTSRSISGQTIVIDGGMPAAMR